MRRGLMSLLLVCAACSGDNGVTRPAAAIGGESASGEEDASGDDGDANAVALTESMAQPYFHSGPAGEAFERFELEEWNAARDGFRAYLEGDGAPTDPAEIGRVRLLIGLAETHLNEWKSAAKELEAAAGALPLIADFIRYEAARAHYFARDLDRSEELAEKVSGDSIRGADAELLVGDILRARGDHDAIAVHYQKYLEDHPEGIRRDEAHYRLAEALEAAGSPDEAAVTYRAITIQWPTRSWGKKATEKLEALTKELPKKRAAELERLNATELLEQAMALYDANRNPWSAKVFEQALAAPGITAEQKCTAAYHLADSWFKERTRSKSAPLFDKAIELCGAAGDDDLQIKAAYQAGRSYDKLDEEKTSVKRFATAEKLAKKIDHSYADDARLRQAEDYEEMGGHDEKVVALLSKVPDLYPDGDMRAEAMWRLAWKAYRDGDHEQTVKWLKKQIETKPLEDRYQAEGQPQYWLGRTYGKLGKTEESIAAYKEAIRKYPVTYYAMLALNRLREQHKDAFEEMKAEIEKVPAGYDPKKPAFQFEARALYGKPGFRRAIELLRLGIGWASEAELARLDLTPPDGRDEVTDPDEREKLWAMAYLHHNAGRYEPSHWVTRWHLLDYKRSWPTGANRARWEIAYPKAWWDLIEEHAKKHGYPVELQMAIVREESAFDPLRESWANAIGLTQMIYPTAKRFGKGTGIEINRENLRDPEKNVTIGSNFLVFLWDKWAGHTHLIPPSYNAGENAVARWIKERGDWASDEWAEAIPYDQPRRYSKRVLSSYFAYSYIYGGQIPTMRNDIPKKFEPKRVRGLKGADKPDYGNYGN